MVNKGKEALSGHISSKLVSLLTLALDEVMKGVLHLYIALASLCKITTLTFCIIGEKKN